MLRATDLTPGIGSEVAIGADELVSGAYAEELRELLVKRGVLVMRDIHFDDDQLRAFTATMGKLRLGGPHENKGILKVELSLPTYFWHIDATYDAIPPFATVLAPQVLPPEGGDTEFANTYAAFEDLPTDEQEFLSTLKTVCSMKAGVCQTLHEITPEHLEMWKPYQRVQPLVWRHRGGRRSLVIGASTSHVIDMHIADSHELLQRLVAHASQDKYVYRHRWRMGDIVMWDNTGTMHRVRPYNPSSGRLLHRCTVEGVEPLSAVAGSNAA